MADVSQEEAGIRVRRNGNGILPVDAYTMVDHPWPQAGMCHRRLIDKGLMHFDEELPTAECRLWTWGLFLNASSYAVLDTAGFIYRKGTPTSLTEA